jgi:DNA ligase-1
LKDVQLHGEALIRHNGEILPREEGNGILNSIQSGEELPDGYEIVVVLWDIIPTSVAIPKGKYDVPYSERYETLVTRIPHTQYVSIVQTKVLFKVEDIKQFYKQVRELGHEGLVIKAPYMKWKDGTSTEQFKLKAEVIVELEAYALTEGEGKNAKTFGSISMRSSDELVLVDVSGIKDDMRKYIFDNWSMIRGKIFSVKSNALISNKKIEGKYSLYLPRVVEIRNDKVLANSYQEIVDEFESSLDKIEFPF